MKSSIIAAVVLLSVVGRAFAQSDKILELQKDLKTAKDSTQYVDMVNRIAMLFYEQNCDSTLFYAGNAYDIALRMQYQKGLADASNNLGVVYDIQGNTKLSLRYYSKAYNEYVSLKDSSNIVQTLTNIAMVYQIIGKDEKAFESFDRAMALGNKISHDSIVSLLITNYILVYPRKFTASQKQAYINRAGKIAAKYRDVRMQLAVQQLIADNLIADNQRQKGMELLEKTLADAQKLQLHYLSMDFLLDLGDNYFSENQGKGTHYYKRALEVAEQKRYQLYARDICKKLYNIYVQKRDPSNALFYSKKLIKLYEEQQENDRVSGVDYIQYAMKDQQLSAKLKEAQDNALRLWLAIAICALTLISIIFLWRNWKLTRKNNEALQVQFRQLEATSTELERSNHNYARLIKMVAHDLRNPISGINSVSGMMREGNLTEIETREFVQLIQESSSSCLNMIRDLLQTDFSFKEQDLVKQEINVSTFLKQAISLLRFKAKEKDQRLLLEESTQATITADPEKLMRMINNLIGNAIKFSPVAGTIRLSSKDLTNGVLISVADHGVGIPKAFADKLFDPFTPSKRRGTAGEIPFGLGLYISRQIIDAHHGKIWFESDEGKGTTFFVLLPRDKNFTPKISQNLEVES